MVKEELKSKDEKLIELFEEFFKQQELRLKTELEEYRKKDMIFAFSIMAFFIVVLALLHMINVI